MSDITRTRMQQIFTATLCLLFGLSGATVANNGNGKGAGGPGDGSSDGITPAIIEFADRTGDRLTSDGLGQYVHAEEEVRAFIGSKASYGNVWLKVQRSATRGLGISFEDCLSECDPPPSQIYDLAMIKVDANNVQKDGLFGMKVGATIYPPMRVYWDLENDGEKWGFIDFDPKLSGKNPCRNKSHYAVVTRDTETVWTVSSPDLAEACATWPDGSMAGVYWMPFEFTVEIK